MKMSKHGYRGANSKHKKLSMSTLTLKALNLQCTDDTQEKCQNTVITLTILIHIFALGL